MDIDGVLSADYAADESVSPQFGITRWLSSKGWTEWMAVVESAVAKGRGASVEERPTRLPCLKQ